MRLLHTADWHLGRIFYERHLTEDQRKVLLEQFLPLLKEAQIDAVILAGDIYDRAVPPVEAVTLLNEVLVKVAEDYKMPFIAIGGNHDSGDRLAFGNSLLREKQIYIEGRLEKRPSLISLEDTYGPVYFAPMPFEELPYLSNYWDLKRGDSFTEAYGAWTNYYKSQIPKGARAVAIAHGFVAGGQACESERSLSVGGSEVMDGILFKDFSYTALGHLHRPQQVKQKNLRYAGSLLPYSFDEEKQEKSFTIVDIKSDGAIDVELVPVEVPHRVKTLKGSFEELLNYPQEEHRGKFIQIILTDRNPILEPFSQLRKVYPELLTLRFEEPYFTTSGDTAKNYRNLNERELLVQFVEASRAEGLSEEEHQFINALWDEIGKEK